jgi:amidase
MKLSDLAMASLLKPEDQAVLKCGILSDLDIEITTDAPILVSLMTSRRYTAVQVMKAFCERATIAQQCLNCLIVFLYESAMKRAKELDDYMAQTGKPVGILHGLPVSLKDIFDIQEQTTVGMVSWLPYIATKNATITDSTIAAGGILLAKLRLHKHV